MGVEGLGAGVLTVESDVTPGEALLGANIKDKGVFGVFAVLAAMPPMMAARGGVSKCVTSSCLSLAAVRVHL